MGKNKGKFKGGGAWIPRDLYTSRAYLSLSGFAPQLLILFYGKRDMKQVKGRWVCKNASRLTMTYAELENIFDRCKGEPLGSKQKGVTRPRIIRAISDLLAKGFIEIIHQGGAFQKDKSIYALSENWRIWSPGAVFNTRKKDTRTRGFRKPQK